MTKVIFEELCPAGIPLIFCAPENAQKLPVVFYIHGFAGDKRGGVEIAYNLAQRGIATVSLDAALHGGRLDFRVATTWEGPQKGDLYPFATGLDRFFLIMKIIEDTLEDISKLLDTFREDPRLDGQRMGICGASMGGFIAYCFAAKNPSVKALATLISFPSLKQRWQDSILESSLQPAYAEQMAGLFSVTEERTKVVDALDPVEGLKKFAPKPLLMVIGDLDTDTHKSYSLRFYEKIKPFYEEKPGNLQYKVHPGAIHRVTSGMVNDAVDWFAKNL
ncbi:MAG: prolyl oligopeptidase family serine peptidase [Anaerolineaceae bacterium]|nr:prolyl oligopeptidase family serine peptidase [Anaerolineaceae bacterium]